MIVRVPLHRKPVISPPPPPPPSLSSSFFFFFGGGWGLLPFLSRFLSVNLSVCLSPLCGCVVSAGVLTNGQGCFPAMIHYQLLHLIPNFHSTCSDQTRTHAHACTPPPPPPTHTLREREGVASCRLCSYVHWSLSDLVNVCWRLSDLITAMIPLI